MEREACLQHVLRGSLRLQIFRNFRLHSVSFACITQPESPQARYWKWRSPNISEIGLTTLETFPWTLNEYLAYEVQRLVPKFKDYITDYGSSNEYMTPAAGDGLVSAFVNLHESNGNADNGNFDSSIACVMGRSPSIDNTQCTFGLTL